MRVDKSGLASVLLEAGEENAAVLLIRAPLPELLDTETDFDRLSVLGLEPEALDELLALAVERIDDGDDDEHFGQTLSRRYSNLVQSWPPRLGRR